VFFPRTHFTNESKQVRKAIGVSSTGWEPDDKTEELRLKLQREMQNGLLDDGNGCFNEIRFQQILKNMGFKGSLRVATEKVALATVNDEAPPKPQLSLMEVWDMYCEYRKHDLRESVYNSTFQGQYKNYLKSAIEATKSEDALKIRNWLVENRYLPIVKNLLSCLSKAYQLGMKNRILSHNPYEGMAEEILRLGAQGKQQDEIETDNDTEDSLKTYTWTEAQAILDYIESNSRMKHWYSFVKFKFLTGCRTGEAIALRWNDINWDSEKILFRATYDKLTKKFYPLNNDKTYKGQEVRRFPMPKDGELWQLLKSIPQGELNDVVFKSKRGKIIDDRIFGVAWQGRNSHNKQKGIIRTLIEQGKLSKYLPPYNTRHTFINHAIHDLKIPEKIVCYMCGHQADVSNKHYQDEAIFMKGINPEIPFSQQDFGLQKMDNQQTKIETLEEQIKKLQEQLEEMKNK